MPWVSTAPASMHLDCKVQLLFQLRAWTNMLLLWELLTPMDIGLAGYAMI